MQMAKGIFEVRLKIPLGLIAFVKVVSREDRSRGGEPLVPMIVPFLRM